MKIQKRTRKAHRFVEITEHKCQWCGRWFETTMANARHCPQPATCRMQTYMEARGEPARNVKG